MPIHDLLMHAHALERELAELYVTGAYQVKASRARTIARFETALKAIADLTAAATALEDHEIIERVGEIAATALRTVEGEGRVETCPHPASHRRSDGVCGVCKERWRCNCDDALGQSCDKCHPLGGEIPGGRA